MQANDFMFDDVEVCLVKHSETLWSSLSRESRVAVSLLLMGVYTIA